MQKIKNLLSGKKTYIVGILMVLISIEKYITGETTLSQFLTTVQGEFGFMGVMGVTIRAAIAKQ